MGGGIRSKFKFPVPGRSSKKQELPTVSISTPLSKAQRVLGADGINIGSSRLAVNHVRSWETASAAGISVSISESNASQITHDTGFDQENGDDTPETNYGRSVWEEESAIIPRQVQSAHGPGRKGLTTKPSLYTVGNDSRGQMTNASTLGRRPSSSTIDTHYDPTRMPLAISQQTSNSAMAKGIGSKISEVLDMDGTLAAQQGKKKSSRLDFSRLRPKGYKHRNNYDVASQDRRDTRSPSFMSQQLESPLPSGSTAGGRFMRKLTKQQPTTRNPQQLRPSRSRGITDTTGLHQLYNHYEKMSFRDEEDLEELDESEGEIDHEDIPASPQHSTSRQRIRPPSTFTHSLIAPLPLTLSHGQAGNLGHSRNNSQDSRITSSAAESSRAAQVHSASSQKDYAGSVSSRHTRTSKASPSSRSLLESDRLQSSVLSLSDSSDDEATESMSSAPQPHRASFSNVILPDKAYTGGSHQRPGRLHVNTAISKFTPSLNQLDEHLGVNTATRSHSSRSPSNNTTRSSQSSGATVTQAHIGSSSGANRQPSSRSIETMDALESSHQSIYGVQEARVVSFMPLASTAEAASQVSLAEPSTHVEKFLLRQNSNATSRFSRSSEPTPPLSPASVEFYVKSRESLQRDAIANGSTEAHNARLMAVTRQEEMLLAALRKKRAKMREANSEAEDEKSPTSISNQGSLRSVKRSNTASSKGGSREPTIPEHRADLTTSGRQRMDRSLYTTRSREDFRRNQQYRSLQKDLHDVDVPSTASHSDVTEGTATSATESASSTTFDSRDDGAMMYFDRPNDDVDAVDPDVDSSDYMDDSDGEDLIVNERRTSRMQFRRDSASGSLRMHGAGNMGGRRGSNHNMQCRKDSSPISPLTAPLRGNRLQDVPEDEYHQPAFRIPVDGALDGFPQPPVPPPSWPLPPRPEKASAVSASPTSSGMLHPSSAMQQPLSPDPKATHLKSKRSHVRLSAVGQVYSPMPHWGDDD
ncbi:hypothetical protein GGS20DRAFT_58409 [Poronia punctata]|nr:hypothetical protein GGS20DRAFT_58409 [Poronia punctata]